MNWEDLHTAAAVARHRGFGGAAAELGVDPTTISRRIARLEQALGGRLFDLVEGERLPTPGGEAALSKLAVMEREADEIRRLASPGGAVAGRVRLTCTATIAEQVLAPEMAAFLAAHPALRIDLAVGDANANLQRWESDLAIRLARPERGDFVARRLASLQLWFIRPRDPVAQPVVCAYPEELEDVPEMRALTDAGLMEDARLVSSQVSVIRELLRSGLAIGVLPEPAARELLRRDDLDCSMVPEPREVWLLTQERLRMTPPVLATSTWIDACFVKAGLKGDRSDGVAS